MKSGCGGGRQAETAANPAFLLKKREKKNAEGRWPDRGSLLPVAVKIKGKTEKGRERD
jgi:hypothetical protein